MKDWLGEKKHFEKLSSQVFARAQEMRIDEFSRNEWRKSHATIQELSSQIQELQERMKLYERFERISRFRIDLQCEIISRSQSASRSKSSIYVEARPKPAT